jgi:hypothetical protein
MVFLDPPGESHIISNSSFINHSIIWCCRIWAIKVVVKRARINIIKYSKID